MNSDTILFLGVFGIVTGIYVAWKQGWIWPWGFPYKREPYLLTRSEFNFYQVLSKAMAGECTICPKVRLVDLVNVRPGMSEKRAWVHRGKIVAKHVDFALCDDKLRPLMVIELDDPSHDRKDRKARDRFVDKALAAAGLPILHIKTKRSYDVEEIRHQISTTYSRG